MPPNLGAPPVLEPGSLVLVTGANGFLASHVVDQLILAGYRVRGTVRSASRTGWLKELFDKRHGAGKFEIAVVEDMAKPEAYDEACIGVSGVAHVASVLTMDPNPNNVVPQVVAGAVNIAESAVKVASIKRLVYTSSSVAITSPKPNEKFEVSINDWNEEDIKKAWADPPYTPERSYTVYCASKTQAEQAIWKFAEERKPGFVINTVLPNAMFGEILSEKQSASTGAWIKGIFKGNSDAMNTPPQWMVNVKDSARLHVSALIDSRVETERILAFAEPYNWSDILAILRKLYPDKIFPDDIPNEPRDLSTLDHSRGVQLLQAYGRTGFTSLEESVRENTAGLKA
ncbi:MAG: hypothetical protein Q9195_003498 [Heterodermia aff. obscurata]